MTLPEGLRSRSCHQTLAPCNDALALTHPRAQGFVLESTKKKREAAAQNATLQVRGQWHLCREVRRQTGVLSGPRESSDVFAAQMATPASFLLCKPVNP